MCPSSCLHQPLFQTSGHRGELRGVKLRGSFGDHLLPPWVLTSRKQRPKRPQCVFGVPLQSYGRAELPQRMLCLTFTVSSHGMLTGSGEAAPLCRPRSGQPQDLPPRPPNIQLSLLSAWLFSGAETRAPSRPAPGPLLSTS